MSPEERTNRIERFAEQNHWHVTFRELGTLGQVAEFTKTDGFQHAA
jgi:hypothetical protein